MNSPNPEVAKAIYDANAILFGDFTLASGKKSRIYFDMRKLPSFPESYNIIISALTKNIPKDTDVIVSTETAGLCYGAPVADRLNLGFAYARKKEKEHGTGKLLEGIVEGKNVSIVDDLNTTLGTVGKAINAVRQEGGKVIYAEVIFDRKQYFPAALAELGVNLNCLIDVEYLFEYGIDAKRIDQENMDELIKQEDEMGEVFRKVVAAKI